MFLPRFLPRVLPLVALLLAAPAARAQDAPAPADPTGTWLTDDDGGAIRVAPCGDRLCGWVSGLSYHPDGTPPQSYLHQSQCGFNLIRGLARTGPNLWQGTIVNPEDGQGYASRIWLDDAGRLRLRGYVGLPIFGRTTVWHRFAGRIGPECRLR